MKNVLLLMVLLLPALFAFGQEYKATVHHFSTEEGLSGRMVESIIQDKRGFIWATTNHGADQFDGYRFLNRGKNIWYKDIFEDVNGKIWLVQKKIVDREGLQFDFNITISVLDVFSKSLSAFEDAFSTPAFFSEDEISEIRFLGGNVWIKLYDGRLISYDGTFTLHGVNAIGMSLIKDIMPMNKDAFWVSKRDSLLLIDSAGNIAEKTKIGKKCRVRQMSPLQEDELSLFCYCWRQKKYQVKVFTKSINSELLPNDIFNNHFPNKKYRREYKPLFSFRESQNGLKWCWHDMDLKVIDSKGKIVFNFKDINKNAGGDIINDVLYDDQDNAWVATNDGIYFINLKVIPFRNYLNKSKTPYSCRGIARLDTQTMLINSYQGSRIVNLETGDIKRIDGLKDYFGMAIFQDEDKSMYWGGPCNKGIHKLLRSEIGADAGYLLEIKVHDLCKFEELLRLYRDKKTNTLWIGTYMGLAYEDSSNQEIKEVHFDSVPGPGYITHFYENEMGVWIAAHNGLFLFDPIDKKIIKHINKASITFPSDKINFIYEDQEGIFWLATKGDGLIKWNPETYNWLIFNKEHGLLNLVLQAIYEDQNNNLWIPSEYGLVKFNKETTMAEVLLPRDGIPNTEFNIFSHYEDEQGNLYFGGLNGVTVFHPDSIKASSVSKEAIPMYVSSLKIIEKTSGDLIERTEEFQKSNSIVVDATFNSFIIEFVLLDYLSKGAIIYAYQIEGVDRYWNYQKENYLRLNNLPYGSYKLRIKAQGQLGQWSEKELVIPIKVIRPFYESPLFYWMCGFGLLLGTYLFYQWRTLRLRNKKLLLEKEVAERTLTISRQNKTLADLNATKDQFFAIIAHDLRGPVLAFQGLFKKINFLLERNEMGRLLDLIKSLDDTAGRLNGLLDSLLNWAMLEKGAMPLKRESVVVKTIIEENITLYKEAAEAKQVNFIVKIADPQLKVNVDKNMFRVILRNLISNALKFSNSKGNVTISTKPENQNVIISIHDNGIGIPADKLDHIFRNAKVTFKEGTAGEKGTGLGLMLCKQFIDLNQGSISIKSKITQGTIVNIILPLADKGNPT